MGRQHPLDPDVEVDIVLLASHHDLVRREGRGEGIPVSGEEVRTLFHATWSEILRREAVWATLVLTRSGYTVLGV